MSVIRSLECACCGNAAGRWKQWWNQDTGYGLCAPCAVWIASRGTSQDEIDETYGREGEHRAPTTQAQPKG